MGPQLTNTRIREGVWEAQYWQSDDTGAAPELGAYHLDTALSDLSVTPLEEAQGRWAVRLPIPATVIGEGVNTIVVKDLPSGETLASIPLIAGEPLEDDLRAEIGLLRAELDMLKKAFRRHCLETA